MNIFWHIFSLFLLWNLLVFHGTCEALPPICKKSFITLVHDHWYICKVKEKKNLYYFINVHNINKKDICSLTLGLLGEDKFSQKVNGTKPCEEDVMQLVENFEEQTVLDSDECNQDWKTLVKDKHYTICRVQHARNLYRLRHETLKETCIIEIRSYELIGRDIKPCVTGPAPKPPGSANPCENAPCLRGGTCVAGATEVQSYVCVCPLGYDPETNCRDLCRIGMWGEGCANKCGGCAESTRTIQHEVFFRKPISTCDAKTGCLRCAEGVTPMPLCNKVSCRKARCRNNGMCASGRCTCLPGYTGTLCETDLGKAELERCDLSKYNQKEVCSRNGICFKVQNEKKRYKNVCRCKKGWAGERCDEPCLEGAENCLHGVCEQETKCTCFDGYISKYCNKACPAGSWGQDCKERCGNCKFFPCRNTDGICPKNRCRVGYRPPLCSEVNPSLAEQQQLYTVQMEIETDDEEVYYDALEYMEIETDDEEEYYDALELGTITEKKAARAVMEYVEQQLYKILAANKAAEVADVTLSPAPATPLPGTKDKFFARNNEIIKPRQRGRKKAGLIAECTVILPPNTIVNSETFTKNLARKIKNNVDDFEGGGFKVDPGSVQVTTVNLPDESTKGYPGNAAVYGLLGALTVVLAIAGAIVVKGCSKNRSTGTKRTKDIRPAWQLKHASRRSFRPQQLSQYAPYNYPSATA